jgi:hypothetical protein
MAQSSSQPKRKPRENQYIFDLGVRGRWVVIKRNGVLRLIYQ